MCLWLSIARRILPTVAYTAIELGERHCGCSLDRASAEARRTRGAVWLRPGGLRKRDPRKTCYCENVKNITVSVPDEVYRNARVTAAQRDTSVSALVVAYLEQLSGGIDEFARLETLQHEVQAGIRQFRASDRMSRDEVHDRAVR